MLRKEKMSKKDENYFLSDCFVENSKSASHLSSFIGARKSTHHHKSSELTNIMSPNRKQTSEYFDNMKEK